jgi:hypothetical protein
VAFSHCSRAEFRDHEADDAESVDGQAGTAGSGDREADAPTAGPGCARHCDTHDVRGGAE